MVIDNDFDIYSDFYSPSEMKILFKEEYDKNITSKEMWALVMYIHPKSKFSDLSYKDKALIISKDYLDNPSFDFDAHTSTLSKIKSHCMTKVERLLAAWEKKLDEREEFMDSVKYSKETQKFLDGMMKETHIMKKNYREILKEFSEEKEQKVHGQIEESLSEKGVI